MVFLCFCPPLFSLFFFVCLFFCVTFLFFVSFFVFFGRVEGSGEVARRATSLGPQPSLFVICFFVVLLVFVFFWFVFFGGFKGQVRWPEGPPHLALNPPYLLFVFFGSFPFFAFHRQKKLFPLKRAFLLIFSVSLSFSLCLFWPPPFSISLSLSLCCYFLFTFLLVFLFCVLFVSWFCLLLSFSFFFAFVSGKGHQNIQLQFISFPEIFLFLLVSCLVICLKSLFLIFPFS